MSKKAMTSRTKIMSTNEKKANLTEINEELQKLKIEYKKEYEIYTASSSDIIESEKK